MKIRYKTSGFTLIELMITVAVIGILAAIAYPSYQDSIRKSRRADAKSALLNAAQSMEKFYTENSKYTGATVGTVVPASSTDGYYTLSFSVAPSAAAYTLQAAPTTKGNQGADKCGNFTLSSTGVKGVNSGTLGVADCW
ncbi:MAG: type IV pilin protein [Sulfuricella sp.]